MQESSLKDIYQDQRAELAFRRNREQTIFVWSNTILIGAIAWFSSSNQPFEPLGRTGYLVSLAGVIALTVFSLSWQGRQRDLMRNHQRILSEIAKLRGWFNQKNAEGKLLLPVEWQNWGTKRALGWKWGMTLILGVTASLAILLSMFITVG